MIKIKLHPPQSNETSTLPPERGSGPEVISGTTGDLPGERSTVTTTEETIEGVSEGLESRSESHTHKAASEPKVFCRLCKAGSDSEEELYTHWLVAHPTELYQLNQWLRETEARLKSWEREVDEREGKQLEKRTKLEVTRKLL